MLAKLAVLLVTAPRSPISYPLYVGASFLIVDWKRASAKRWMLLLLLLSMAGISHLRAQGLGQVSTTAWALALIMMLPILLFLSGFRSRLTPDATRCTIRSANLVVASYSVINLFIAGFPSAIPYINLSPDYLSALYGFGGARILTVIGFAGILVELRGSSKGKRARRLSLAVAIGNFALPSYILGILAGLFVLILMGLRSPSRVAMVAMLAVPSLWYAITERLPGNNSFIETATGSSAKELAYILPWRLFTSHPELIYLGTSPGQFSSTPQNWTSPGLRVLARQEAPAVPGLEQSSFATEIIEPINSLSLIDPFALSSSLNKPYTGVSTLWAEWGLVGLVAVVALFVLRARSYRSVSPTAYAFLAFVAVINMVDLWSDNLWLGWCVLVMTGLAGEQKTDSQHPHHGLEVERL